MEWEGRREEGRCWSNICKGSCRVFTFMLLFMDMVVPSVAQIFTSKEEQTELHKPQHMPKYGQHSTCKGPCSKQLLWTLPSHDPKSEGEPSWSQSVKTGLRFQIFAETTLKYGDEILRDMKSREEAREEKRKEKENRRERKWWYLHSCSCSLCAIPKSSLTWKSPRTAVATNNKNKTFNKAH